MNKLGIQQILKVCFIAGLITLPTSQLQADGTETLGIPDIDIAGGTGVVTAGAGLIEGPGDIVFHVPGRVKQVLLYWEGAGREPIVTDDTITVNDIAVEGTLIGGPTFFVNDFFNATHRADITDLGLVNRGSNILTVDNFDVFFPNGAGVVVVYKNRRKLGEIDIRDGNDLALNGFGGERKVTAAQTLEFMPSRRDRIADLSLFVSSVSGTASTGDFRSSAIDVTIGGTTETFNNLLDSNDGEEWDTVNLNIVVPAGETEMTVELLSVDNLDTGDQPASMVWSMLSLSMKADRKHHNCKRGSKGWGHRCGHKKHGHHGYHRY